IPDQRRHRAGPVARGTVQRLPPAAQAGAAVGAARLDQPIAQGDPAYVDPERGVVSHGVPPGRSRSSVPAATTASVRLVAFRAFRIAVTWLLTVGSARSSTRQIALLLLPCIINDSTSICRSVRPSSAAEVRLPTLAAARFVAPAGAS